MVEKYPVLGLFVVFMIGIHELFRKDQDIESAKKRYDAIVTNEEFLANKYTREAIEKLRRRRFERLFVYLHYRNLDCTTNHVERKNRWFRKMQKCCYRVRNKDNIEGRISADLMRDKKEKEIMGSKDIIEKLQTGEVA